MHRASEADADHQPKESRQESELRRQHGTNQRARAGDRREVMPEQDPLVRWIVVVPVIHRLRRHRSRIVQSQNLRRYERRVVAIRDRQYTQRTDNYGQGIHLFESQRDIITAVCGFCETDIVPSSRSPVSSNDSLITGSAGALARIEREARP